jgi:hypothetical protein
MLSFGHQQDFIVMAREQGHILPLPANAHID